MGLSNFRIDDKQYSLIKEGAIDQSRISGLTHNFYRYPARFSPAFVRACIKALSEPGDRVFDPYMGGGTTVLEAMTLGRRGIGCDINSLSVFVARTKTTLLTKKEACAVLHWADSIVPTVRCKQFSVHSFGGYSVPARNLSKQRVRWIGKLISAVLKSIACYQFSPRAEKFARCVVLNTAQWALNGRRSIPSSSQFRDELTSNSYGMLKGISELKESLSSGNQRTYPPVIFGLDAESLSSMTMSPVDLVVTSPPYPGVHALYHRWQVDGRKETDAPYWIAKCTDGSGAAYYSFADRQAEDGYFDKAQRTFSAIHSKMRPGAVLVQMVAFSQRNRQLPRYLRMLERSGFSEVRESNERRIWRPIPSRKWHATLKGQTCGSREVVLIHVAE